VSEASPLLTAALMGAAFGLGFFFLLFALWASGKSPFIQRCGEMVVSLLYLAGIAAQAWNAREGEQSDLWRLATVAVLLTSAATTFRFFKALRRGDDADAGLAR